MTQWITMDIREFNTERREAAIKWMSTRYNLSRKYVSREWCNPKLVGYLSFDDDLKRDRHICSLAPDFKVPSSDIIIRMGVIKLGEM